MIGSLIMMRMYLTPPTLIDFRPELYDRSSCKMHGSTLQLSSPRKSLDSFGRFGLTASMYWEQAVPSAGSKEHVSVGKKYGIIHSNAIQCVSQWLKNKHSFFVPPSCALELDGIGMLDEGLARFPIEAGNPRGARA